MSKKTVQLIVSGGNDYLVGIKGNQPKLLAYVQQLMQQQTPTTMDTQVERTHGRVVERTVKVYNQMSGIDPDWENAQSLIAVERQGTRAGQPFQALSYYLSSLNATAIHFALGIRGHRDIENGLHWVKDVVFGEDTARFRAYNAATNWSIIRTIVLNLLRSRGYRSLTKALRLVRHNLDQLFSILTMN